MNDELQVIDLQVGEGKAAVKGALITTHYTGWLEDGSEFDSSHSRGKPFQCVIGTGRVIKGWDQGLMGMQVGGKRRLLVPAIWGTASGRWARFRRIRIWCLRLNCWRF
jgi:peptidylprolyl isomerase